MNEQYMQRCLDLAIQGLGNVAPNPMVGCVIVHADKIIGEGHHKQFGGAHAEVNAINSVANCHLLQEATLYVNLEPCSHFGKTPPCADLILEKKIPRVVIGSYDPNPEVSGKGIQKLKNWGVNVVSEVLKQESDFLNRRFMTFYKKFRPYIILKWAQSEDGFMSPHEGKQFWLTNDESKKLTHKWRTEEQAILVGRKTVATDDCELTARLWEGTNPVRIVIDRQLVLPRNKKVFNAKSKTLVFNESENKNGDSVESIKIDFSKNVVNQITDTLFQRQIQSVIVEGGSITLNHFVHQNIWDEARIFVTPHRLTSGKRPPKISGKLIEQTDISGDILRTYLNPKV